MLTFYSVIVLEVVFLMVLLVIMANTNDLLSQHKRKLFLLLFFCIILSIIAEWSGSMTVLFNGRYRQLHIWTKVLELSMTPVVPFICAQILNYSVDTSQKNKWVYYILTLHTVLEVLSAFAGFIFYVDSNGVFCPWPFLLDLSGDLSGRLCLCTVERLSD